MMRGQGPILAILTWADARRVLNEYLAGVMPFELATSDLSQPVTAPGTQE